MEKMKGEEATKPILAALFFLVILVVVLAIIAVMALGIISLDEVLISVMAPYSGIVS